MKYVTQTAILLLFASIAYAHGPELEVDKKSAAPGERITLRGEGITANGSIVLTLRGMLQDYPLGEVQGDAHGRFEKTVTLPRDLPPGTYTLLASGDKRATARLEVTRRAAPENLTPDQEQRTPEQETARAREAAGGHAEEEHEHAEGEEIHPKAGPMPIERRSTVAENLLAWGTVLLSAALGLGLLFRGRRQP